MAHVSSDSYPDVRGDLQLEGPTVEVDETYYGGVRKYGTGRPMRGDKQKTPIVGIVQRKGCVVAKTAPDVKGSTLLGIVREHVLPASTIYTDELPGYHGISYMRSKDGSPRATIIAVFTTALACT